MSKLFTEAGFLSSEGNRVFKEVLDSKIKMLLSQASNEQELRIISSLILQRVGEMTSTAITTKQQTVAELKKLSVKELCDHFEKKYGPQWVFVSLTPEELEACPVLTEEELRQALEEGAEQSQAMFDATKHISFPNPRTRYR